MYAVADFQLLHRGGGGESSHRLSVDAVGLLPYAVGRHRAGRGSGRREVRRENPLHQQEHVRLDPGRGDGGAGQRRVPHGAVLHHRPGGHRALHRAPRDREPRGGGRGRRRGAPGQPARALLVPRTRRRRRRPRALPRGALSRRQGQEGDSREGWERVGGRGDQQPGGEPQQPGGCETKNR